jgi:hypothetical protein
MTILYSNGCSYTYNHLVPKEQRYQHILAERFGWEIESAAIPGSCTRRIIRCAMRDCIKLSEGNQPIVALVQLTHLTRIEYAGNGNSWRYAKEDPYESLNGIGHPDNTDLANDLVRSSFLLHNERAELTRVMSELIGMTSFFKQHNIKYLIYTGPKILVEPAEIADDTFYQYLKQDRSVLDLAEFNMLALTGEQRHPDKTGNEIIADYFFNLLCESM